ERREALERERKEREAQRVANPLEAMKESGRQPTTAGGIMSPIKSIAASATVDEAMHQMRENNISSILVEPDGSNTWGIMTQRDIVMKIVGANKSAANVKVSEIASQPLVTVPSDLSLRRVSQTMIDNRVRRVVVESNEQPVGIVSETDLFRIVEEFGWEPEE
ncbi:MAG: CBS domain-containing protein, partial [Burkholderiales bacterium]|nr:CBS domain-containing protein [Burkholderiales bacterium]